MTETSKENPRALAPRHPRVAAFKNVEDFRTHLSSLDVEFGCDDEILQASSMSVPLNNLLIMDTQIGVIYDADGGDGDGVPNPGESVEISVDIINESIERTLRWSELCLNNHDTNKQSLFGIIQGGISEKYREYSLLKTIELDFDGYAIGGLSVGENEEDRNRIVKFCSEILPKNKPRYVMGLGDIKGMLDLIEFGVDMFDCVWPTRLARHGKIIDKNKFINLKNNKYKYDANSLVDNCNCKTCNNYSRSYLRHLLLNEEVSSWPYLVEHNLYQTKNILDNAREAIILGSFKNYKESLDA